MAVDHALPAAQGVCSRYCRNVGERRAGRLGRLLTRAVRSHSLDQAVVMGSRRRQSLRLTVLVLRILGARLGRASAGLALGDVWISIVFLKKKQKTRHRFKC